MPKAKLGKKLPFLPLPICLAGANVEGRPNFCTIAWFTMIDDEPPTIGLVMGKRRRTKDGIVENGTFSVNIPRKDMVAETDWCGMNSGYDVDKSEVFKVSYGKLGTAPMIDGCPISIECRLAKIIPFEGVDLVVGEIEEVHVEEDCMQGKGLDPKKVDAFLLWMPHGPYLGLGERVAEAYRVKKLPVKGAQPRSRKN